MSKYKNFDYIDIAVDSLNKYKEELCGDHVEITENEYSKIIVLSDGLGSGVKANILATLTSNICSTMLRLGSNIIEVLETLEKTLPICKVRELAYSTFSIIQIYHDKRVQIIEYGNPRIVYIRDGELLKLEEQRIIFKEKEVIQSFTTYKKGDTLSIFSDGVVHTGIGKYIYLGWQWEEVVKVLKTTSRKSKSAKPISKAIIDICNTFSDYEPGDDTTCVVIRIRDIEKISLFSGPPKDKEKDRDLIHDLVYSQGKKVICGGTAANICAREMNKEIETNFEYFDPSIPPYAKIDGIDLVTEGVLTINEAIRILNESNKTEFDSRVLDRDNGASKLAKLIINDCTHLDILIGNSINPAHQNPFFPDELNIKWKSTTALIKAVESLGKTVEIKKY
ncbi:Stage II sporulation protein E (SpoIIE) [Candidatus Izimaplasma bacterium HR1]|jgi:hypothetical protein|uniref:SpoIIE family protein phosphatase n=1 Tax=Candidatus Izimoplasma sp. HR1 TaxID=1541959 RepID=UPI0004F81631|nr:Stage II sporulation protein E (SpoIIE) [Candidatus Izimaplasma bacterium HR1]